jgi:NADH-quinone oxidoreductase subunit G
MFAKVDRRLGELRMPTCKINGKEIEVAKGTTIIEAFKKMNEDICHYCWHPGLSVAGVCRLCMVQIEGMPKLQIACNTEVKDGMVITNQSEPVKDTVRWGLDFHLINHPLDCPICDQAGECGLQDQYMQFGKYDPEMHEPKVRKRKVVDLGPTVVLDTERCILCSRCVRFTDEVSKTHELGIFNRGDHSEIGTFDGKPLANQYSLNTVDICPVGALTSRDFRFRQRVWYLKDVDTICPGCSTGCSVKVYHNEEGTWRVKPRYNPEVNGHWMCDVGRDVYKFVNRAHRLTVGMITDNGTTRVVEAKAALGEVLEQLQGWIASSLESISVVLTGQQTCEEYEKFIGLIARSGIRNVYHWRNNSETFESFDGLLLRGDRNPNTKGLLSELERHKLTKPWDELKNRLEKNQIVNLIVVGPENQAAYPDIKSQLDLFAKAANLVWLAAGTHAQLAAMPGPLWQIPLKSFFEKNGTFLNFKGLRQEIKKGGVIAAQALGLDEVADILGGEEFNLHSQPPPLDYLKENFFTTTRGSL